MSPRNESIPQSVPRFTVGQTGVDELGCYQVNFATSRDKHFHSLYSKVPNIVWIVVSTLFYKQRVEVRLMGHLHHSNSILHKLLTLKG